MSCGSYFLAQLHVSVRLSCLLIGALLVTGCSQSRPPSLEDDFFLREFNARSGVKYPEKANAVLNTVAGHMALGRGVLPQAGRYFDEVARLDRLDAATDKTVQLQLTRADIALQLGDVSGALAALDTVAPEMLSIDEQLLQAGLLLEQRKDAEAARLYGKVVSQIASGTPSASVNPIGNDEAEAFLLVALSRLAPDAAPRCDIPRGPIASLVCGRIFEARGSLEPALRSYRLAKQRAPELRSLQLDEYRVLLKLGRSEQVIEALTETYNTNPNDDLQRLLHASPQVDPKILQQEITQLSSGKLNSGDIRGKLAALYLRASQPMAALRELSIVLAVEPRNDSARYLRASLLAAAGRKVEARADLLTIASDKVSFSQARLFVAQLSRLEGNLEQAQADLRPYIDAYPNDRLAVLTYLSLLKEQNKLVEGLGLITAIEATMASSGVSSKSWLELERAHFLKSLGRVQQAREIIEQVLTFEPHNSAAQNFLAYEIASGEQASDRDTNSDLDRALDLAESAVAAQPDEPFYLDTLGWVLFRRGNLARAAEVLTRALELSQGDVVIAEHLGDVLEAISPGSGQAAYRDALERARDQERAVNSIEEREVRQRLEGKVK